jgi:hypothetical protein
LEPVNESKTGRNLDRMDSHTAMLELTEQSWLGGVRLEGATSSRGRHSPGVCPPSISSGMTPPALQVEPAFHCR